MNVNYENTIAVIGMAGRFPGAASIEEFWRNLLAGTDSITHFRREELQGLAASSSAENYIAARGALKDVDLFDAEFFGILPREAEQLDPQQRLFLECAHEAFERAGYNPALYPGTAGVFAGSSLNTYLMANLARDRQFMEKLTEDFQLGSFSVLLGNDKDYLATRVSYKLDLKGPSMAVQSACSTSLVAICQAAQSLLTYGCDVALAGGASVTFPQQRGYYAMPGTMGSLDGVCRPFDHRANGTVFGHGVATVLLKRTEDALRDNDQILGVLRGFAVNNDGADKVSYVGPSVEGQAQVIAAAQAMAGITADQVSYIEAHGTGTPVGDPIEVSALSRAFAATTSRRQFCLLGTAKGNVGHLESASGATGLIKTLLQLQHETIAPLAHFEQPAPALNLEASPFIAAGKATPWQRGAAPRIAGVSSFGVGGTNAHVIVEEAPAVSSSAGEENRPQLLLWSAKTLESRERYRTNLAEHLKSNPTLNLADAAFTLQTGRARYMQRCFAVATTQAEAVEALEKKAGMTCVQAIREQRPDLVFAFPGQGVQEPGMCLSLYEHEPVFRSIVETGATQLKALTGVDLLAALYPSATNEQAAEHLNHTLYAQPAIFIVEYALAMLWMSWGIRPAAVLGHSVGEYVAACVSGGMSFEDALQLIALRSVLMEELPPGAMLAVRASSSILEPLLPPQLEIAALNSPEMTVVSGAEAAVNAFEEQLRGLGYAARRLPSTHAFHSRAVEPILEPFRAGFAKIQFQEPKIRLFSTLTGQQLSLSEMREPEYWLRQLREPVNFSGAVKAIAETLDALFLEVGPSETLAPLIRQTLGRERKATTAIATLGRSCRDKSASHAMLDALGQLWLEGVDAEWSKLYQSPRRRVLLPTYSFDRKRYWIDPPAAVSEAAQPVVVAAAPSILPQTASSTAVLPAQDAGDAPVAAGTGARVIELIAELAGMPAEEITPDSTFLTLGLDSLFLTQFAQVLDREFGVRLSLRRLMSELGTPGKVAYAIDEAKPGLSGTKDAKEVVSGAPVSASAIEGDVTWVRPERFGGLGPSMFVHREKRSEWDAEQQQFLDDLVKDMDRRTARSKAHTQRYRSVHADPRVVSGFQPQFKELIYPVVVERAKGPYLWDTDGNRYIDLLNGFGSIYFGHSPDFVLEAMKQQMDLGFPIGPQTELAGLSAELLAKLTGSERVTFTNTGSEAVLAAMRVARSVTGRNLIVTFTGDYHGAFDEVLARSLRNGRTAPTAPGIPRESVQNLLVLEYGSEKSLEIIRSRAQEIAAVMVEPIQSRHPALRPAEFLRELRAVTAASGSALIFDEVVTGFRVHQGGAQALFDIRADLVTYGKVIAGGMPVGVLAGKSAWMDALDGGGWQFGDDSAPEAGVTFFAGTFVRHPLVMSAVYATLQHLEHEGPDLQQNVAKRMGTLAGDIREMFLEHSVPATLENFSAWFHFVMPTDQPMARLLYHQLRRHGLHIQEAFPCFLTTSHTEQDLQEVRIAFRRSLEEMSQGHAFPVLDMPAIKTAGEVAAPVMKEQREVILAAKMGVDANCAFNEGITVELAGPLSIVALERALNRLLSRHESLRTTFSEDATQFTVHPQVAFELEKQDWSALSSDEASAKMTALLELESHTEFALDKAPLVRFRLITLADQLHKLVMTGHHAVMDGWSINLLIQELGELYSAQVEARQANLAPVIQLTEAAQAQHEFEASDEHARIAAYWRDQYKTLPEPLNLLGDFAPQQTRTFDGGTVLYTFTPQDLTRLKTAARGLGTTFFGLLFSGFAATLHRISGQDDIAIGVPMAGQSLYDGRSMAGHYVNFLPLRSHIQAEDTAATFVQRSLNTVLEANENQRYTYGTLLEHLTVERDPTRPPLTDVQFNLDVLSDDQPFSGLRVQVTPNEKAYVPMSLFFNFVENGQSLMLEAHYKKGLFSRQTVDGMVSMLMHVLEEIAAKPETPANQLPLMSESAALELEQGMNATAVEYPRFSSIGALFEQQVVKTPDHPAVVFKGGQWSYAQLNEQANRIAHLLSFLEMPGGARVMLALDRSPEAIAATLAVVKLGLVYVPVDPEYPQTRIDMMLADSAPSAVVTVHRFRSSFESYGAPIIALDSSVQDLELQPYTNLASHVDAEDPVYVMYTSGSTGTPKGVLIPHRGVVRLVRGSNFASLGPNEVILQAAPLTFDASTLEVWGSLLNGGTLAMLPAGRQSPEEIGATIARHHVTTLWLTASLFHLMVSEHLESLASVRQLLAGGDVLSPVHVAKVLDRYPSMRLINGYGPTENTTFTCCATLTSALLQAPSIPLGPPISNTRVHILDANMKPVPVGVQGELYAAGDGLAIGYLNRPDLTAERFLEYRMPDGQLERVYRTGDLARWRRDGMVEFLGRADNQVKIRGYRVELGEIEHALERHPQVKSAAAIVRSGWSSSTDVPGDKRIAAYVVGRNNVNQAELTAELRIFLRTELPDYMQPSAIMVLDELPLNANGKVDRKQLPAPRPEQLLTQRTYIAPRNQRETDLAEIWSRVLERESPSIDDSIFDLGGDSLQIFRITTLANQRGLQVTARLIFERLTIARVCESLTERESKEVATTAKPVLKAQPRDRFRRTEIGTGQ